MLNQPLRVYADTCVFGGVFDREFSVASNQFFDQVKQGRFLLVISATVVAEIREAPRAVQTLFDD